MRPLSTRTAGFTDSIIRRMTRISNRYGAINLSQGFPDFDPPKEITDRLAEIAPHGPHQYAVTWGAQNFREALAKKQSRWTGLPIEADKNIVVTCGSTEAMMAAMMTVVNPGDKDPLSNGILQARILEWVAMLSSRESSQFKDQTRVSTTAGGFFTV